MNVLKSAVTSCDWNFNFFVTCSDDQRVMVWNPKNWEFLYEFKSDIEEWHTLTYLKMHHEKNQIFISTQNGYLLVWCLENKKILFKKKIHNGSIEGLKWNQKKDIFGTCSSDCTVNIFRNNFN